MSSRPERERRKDASPGRRGTDASATPRERDGAEPSADELAAELRTTRASLHSTGDDLAAANEELSIANEELECANEELQTSKEELLSLNEQLERVNDDLRRHVEDLSEANSDLQNLFAATQIATIFLDRDLRIVKFTPAATALVNLIRGDVGRPLADLAPRFSGVDLMADARDVLRTEEQIERRVRSVDAGGWFILRVMPYRTIHDVVAGVVVTFVDVSELRRVEEALRESEATLKRAQAIAHLGSWHLDLTGNRLTWSDEVYRIFGLQPQEFRATYEAFLEAVHPDDRAKVDAAYSGSLREGRDSYEIEHRVVRRNTGEIRIVYEKCEHLRDSAGQIVGSVGMVHDVTERTRSEAILAESRLKTTTILESITDCCFEVDSAWRFTYVNERALAFMNRRLDECLGRSYWDVLPDAAGSVIEARCRRAVAERTPTHFESRSATIDRWAEFHAYPSESGLTVYFRDITDRKAADEALRVSEARLKTVVENLSEGLVVAETDGMLVHWNPAAIKLHGFASAAEGHKALSQFVDVFELKYLDGTVVPFEQWPLARIIRGERLRGLELELRRRDGQLDRVFSYAGDLVRDDEGRPIVAVLSITDVTDRKEAERSLREANDRLLQADQNKDEFLAVLSHELRNPLAPIRNSLFILDRTPADGEQAKLAHEVMNRQVAQLSRLVDDLLDVTRISRNKIQLRRERIDLSQVVRRAVEDHRSLFEQNRVRIETALAGTLIVSADEARMAQVVSNLLQNAAKFTPAGGSVRVTLEADAATGEAVVRVADTGVGMAPEILSHLFRPFMQADSTLDRSRGGLGLGLALVKGLVDLHGGTVTAESGGAGRGAVFTVRLAVDHAAAHAAKPAAMGEGKADHSRRVLVIEDHEDAADSLRAILELMGHTVAVARDGVEGLATARDFHPEVVLCDIGLPVMNGYDVARAIRADDDLKGVLLVAISGYALPHDVERCLAAGFDGHLAKPPSPDTIATLLRRLNVAPLS